jgi:hypothetical protein
MGSVKYLVAAEPIDGGAYLSRIPDVILPSQFFELVGAQTLSSEQRLMLAILADAINIPREYRISLNRDMRISPNRDKRISFNETSSWIFANGITSSLSFDHVCEALGVDAESLRRRLSESLSEPAGNQRRLRLKEQGRRQGPSINRVRDRRRTAALATD